MGVPSGSQTLAEDSEQARSAIDLPGLVHSHHAVVYRYACRLTGCPAEAEDFAQQAFLIAHQRLAQLRDPACARGWLLAIVRSCYLKSVRTPRAAPAQDLDLDMNEVADRSPPISAIDRDALEAALSQLPNEFRVVLLMYYFEELSYHQIAQQLGLPIGTVMSRLSRAKGHLRRKLEARSSPASSKRPLPQPAIAITKFSSVSPVRASP
jgi:RNA polymerase sigma-70 factor (ECF subfamily)